MTESKVVERDRCEGCGRKLFVNDGQPRGERCGAHLDSSEAYGWDRECDSFTIAHLRAALTAESAERKRMEGRVARFREALTRHATWHRNGAPDNHAAAILFADNEKEKTP